MQYRVVLTDHSTAIVMLRVVCPRLYGFKSEEKWEKRLPMTRSPARTSTYSSSALPVTQVHQNIAKQRASSEG